MKFRASIGLVALAILGWTLAASCVSAHELRPIVATLDVSDNQTFTLTLSANVEALVAGITPEHKDTDDAPGAAQYNALRALSPDQLRARLEESYRRWRDGLAVEFDGVRAPVVLSEVAIPLVGDVKLARISALQLTGVRPSSASSLRWVYPAEFGSSVLRVKRAGSDELETVWLKDASASAPILIAAPQTRSRLAAAADYLMLGFTHIVPKGLDHILFIVGLFLLNSGWRPLLVQVTAFTVAHTISLALGLIGAVDVSPSIVEPLIALSIVYVAVENIITSKLHPWRPAIVFAFGLLHGLGFAGILKEIGLPREELVLGLLSFNVGVELGQLAVLALTWVVVELVLRNWPGYRTLALRSVSAVIAVIGLVWTIERVTSG